MRASSSFRGSICVTFIVQLVVSGTCSCTLLDPPLGLGFPRQREGLSQQASNQTGISVRDTLLLVSAVCFPESYDWQRDTAYGQVPCTLKLYGNGKELLSVDGGPGTGVSAAFDGHHIIDGSLYTVYSDGSGTIVGRDGVRLAHWPESEVVCGILNSADGLYTLGTDFDGTLTLRCDGRAMYSVSGGIPFGGFGADTYGPTGALYEDGGAICFAYRRKAAGGWTVGIVTDGVASDLQAVRYNRSALDARRIGGRNVVLFDDAGSTSIRVDSLSRNITQTIGASWTEAGIVEWNGALSALGRCEIFVSHRFGYGVGNARSFKEIEGPPDYVYIDGDGSLVPLSLADYPECRFFGRSCGAVHHGELALALTPKDGSSPYVLYKGRRTEFPVHGFLSGVSFQIPE
ncbi:MAG: hypothetical protein J5695_06040 [Bacteroidales bacterium]|nr:hypothetical protein [Bacteroidales bacterium]